MRSIEAVKIGTKVYGFSISIKGKQKAKAGQAWLHPENGKAFLVDWPMRLHSQTRLIICTSSPIEGS